MRTMPVAGTCMSLRSIGIYLGLGFTVRYNRLDRDVIKMVGRSVLLLD